MKTRDEETAGKIILEIELSAARDAYEVAGEKVETAEADLEKALKIYNEAFHTAEAAGVSIF